MKRYQEAALAEAQAWIQNAIDGTGVHERVIAERLHISQQDLKRVRRGDYEGLKVTELASILHVCEYRLVMSIVKDRHIVTNRTSEKES